MPDTITIRPGLIEDAAIVVAMNMALAEETEGKSLPREIVERGVATGLSDPGRCLYFLAQIGQDVVGQTMVTKEWSDWRDGWFWWIQSVYVPAPFRRRGVFRTLHQHIRNESKKHADVCGLRLYVHHDNDRAIGTYRELGMAVTEYNLCEEEFLRR